jgi:hypothetical protein
MSRNNAKKLLKKSPNLSTPLPTSMSPEPSTIVGSRGTASEVRQVHGLGWIFLDVVRGLRRGEGYM